MRTMASKVCWTSMQQREVSGWSRKPGDSHSRGPHSGGPDLKPHTVDRMRRATCGWAAAHAFTPPCCNLQVDMINSTVGANKVVVFSKT